jgi:hypothetical protein
VTRIDGGEECLVLIGTAIPYFEQDSGNGVTSRRVAGCEVIQGIINSGYRCLGI